MGDEKTLPTTGAWIVHHGMKLQADQAGASEFPAIDGAAKAGRLLAGMAVSEESQLSRDHVVALAKSAGLNPKIELPTILDRLRERQVIDVASNGSVAVLGVSSRKVLEEAAKLYVAMEPSVQEHAALDLAERTSVSPALLSEEIERISDTFHLTTPDAEDFIRRARDIGFVDSEKDGEEAILFNGNLFRRDSVQKTRRILESLSPDEGQRVLEATQVLKEKGCVESAALRGVLGSEALFTKLRAAGFFDVNTVANDQGEHVFVTMPAAFHKFVDPLVDDAFDLAKALVAALTYGITKSSPERGKIQMPSVLLRRLVDGAEIGPATAIGQDYRVLEVKRVIQLRQAGGGRYCMRLLKRDIGEIALHVLTQGDASEMVVSRLPSRLQSAAMTSYAGPEESRSRLRREQKAPSRKHTADILQTLREQGSSW